MTEALWVAIIMGVPTLLALVGGAFAWTINLVSSQSKQTVKEVQALLSEEREAHADTRDERNYWKAEVLRCRDGATTDGGS